jgi:nucleoid-associated protein YgaU
LWRLAKAYYGDGARLNVIQAFNGLAPADVIHDGQVLLIPEPLLSGAVAPERQPRGATRSAPPG